MLMEASVLNYGERAISGPTEALSILGKIRNKRKEVFAIIMLNGAHRAIGDEIVTIGIVNRTIVHPREVFYPAIMNNAVALIVSHNHPSDCVEPSSDDIEITRRLASAGDILGINVLDHIIVGRTKHYSFIEHGVIGGLGYSP